MPEADDKTERVTMLWPKDLKEKVRDKVGVRGLTKFAVEAVQREYDRVYVAHPKEQPAEQPDPVRLPNTGVAEGATEELAPATPLPGDPVAEDDLVVSPPPAPEPKLVDMNDDFDEHAPMYTQAKKKTDVAAGTHQPAVQEVKKERANNDLFERLQKEGKNLGIDLKPASEVLKPNPKPDEPEAPTSRPPVGMETCPFHPDMALRGDKKCYKCTLEDGGRDASPTPRPAAEPVVAEVAAPAPVAPASSDVCPNCGAELVDGECWECM